MSRLSYEAHAKGQAKEVQTMLDRVTAYTECFEEPQSWAVATIVSVQGSSPSPVGTSMAVSADLRLIGSLSGGCVESSAAVIAQEAIASGETRCESFGPDGTLFEKDALNGVALTCGGQIEVLIQPLSSLDTHSLVHLTELSRKDARLPAELTRAVRILHTAGDDAVTGSDHEELVVEEHREGAPVLFLSGVHDVSVHLARYALQAGWRVQMVDVRPAFATSERVPEGVELTVGDPATVVQETVLQASARPWTAVCVMTHHPDLDIPVLDAALRDGRLDVVGAMGSRRAKARRAKALEELGHSSARIAGIRTPLGLDIQAGNAAETAVSMFAELIAARSSAAWKSAAGSSTARNAGEATGSSLSEQSGPVNRSRPRTISIVREMAA